VNIKNEILIHCKQVLNEKVHNFKDKLNELVSDAENDSKSSAGDKHETARAMMQLEQEKLITQFNEADRQLEILSSINPDEEIKSVRTGALVETNKGIIFLSIPLGRIRVKDSDIMVISAIAPLAKALMNAKKKETITFNGTDYLIKNIS
jgi:vacuolar-type H+-ATPase subunit E/Vma4